MDPITSAIVAFLAAQIPEAGKAVVKDGCRSDWVAGKASSYQRARKGGGSSKQITYRPP